MKFHSGMIMKRVTVNKKTKNGLVAVTMFVTAKKNTHKEVAVHHVNTRKEK